VSEIQKFVARHRFLWADQIYQSAVAATDEEIGSGHGVAVYNNTLAQFSNFWRVPPIKSGAGCQARQAPRRKASRPSGDATSPTS
jgi:hypothetical protein